MLEKCSATRCSKAEYLQPNTNSPMRVYSASLHNQVSLEQAKAKAKIVHTSLLSSAINTAQTIRLYAQKIAV